MAASSSGRELLHVCICSRGKVGERDMQCCVEAERIKAFVLAHFLYQGNDG